jgi:thiamine kinase-like enzyme
MTTSGFPDSHRLINALKTVFFGDSKKGQLKILMRKPSSYYSTAPNEIITIRVDEEKTIQLFCKYSGETSYAHGTRGGVPYEARVYREVLQPLNLPFAKFYGEYTDKKTGETWLFLQYLDKNLRISEAHENAIVISAKWLGRFHRQNEKRISDSQFDFLQRYNSQYYLGWVKRTMLYSKTIQKKYPFLKSIITGWEEIVHELLTPPDTIIHGEFYPNNILLWRDSIHPVDWESTAIAIGEIDLSTLIEKWSKKTIEKCEKEYKLSRWPNDVPINFDRKMDASRLYQQFRWLGERIDWTTSPKIRRRIEQAKILGERLGLF